MQKLCMCYIKRRGKPKIGQVYIDMVTNPRRGRDNDICSRRRRKRDKKEYSK
jgi:hypothetical protein